MATSGVPDRLSPVIFSNIQKITNSSETTECRNGEEQRNEQILTGAQLSDARDFTSKQGQNVSLTPIIVDFRRILQSNSPVDVVPGIPNRELLHAAAALYNTSLSGMTPDVLYECLCDKQARTILLLRDAAGAVDELNSLSESNQKLSPENEEVEDDINEDQDVYEAEESEPGVYAGVYSDQDIPDDSSSDEDSDEEEEEDFSKGIHTFLRNVRRRRKQLKQRSKPVSTTEIGVEHRLVGAITFEKTYCNSGEKIIHLTLVAVRKKYRKFGIGKYLLTQVKDMSIVGQYEAVVVHADNGAIDFFKRYSFTDDLVLNSKWSELAEQYTNCTLMCYLPPFTNHSLLGASMPELDIIAMEKEITKWRERSMEAYRSEMTCVNRLRHEIIHLRALVSSQQDMITALLTENESLKQDKFTIEKEFLEYRMSSSKTPFTDILSDEDDEISAETLIRELEREAKAASARSQSNKHRKMLSKNQVDLTFNKTKKTSEEPYDHGKDMEEFFKVTQDFYEAFKEDKDITTNYEVQMITKAVITPSFLESYRMKTSQLGDDGLTTRLYYCGSLEKPHRIPEILRKGFTEQDLSHGDFGRGLYFSKYPSKAAHFSALGMLLIAEVALGSTETIMKKEKTRKCPSPYFHSIITRGRLSSSHEPSHTLNQEYVVFDVHQACPLYLVTYKPVSEVKDSAVKTVKSASDSPEASDTK